jgi:ribonuclease VapC
VTELVLDASALLACILREPGGDEVRGRTSAAQVSALNYGEVVTKLIDRGAMAESAAMVVRELDVSVVVFDEAAALRAGALRPLTRHLGLSLGDRACLALAQATGLPVLTADKAWAELDLGVEVVLIR